MPVAECVCELSDSRGRAAAVAHRLGTPTPAPSRLVGKLQCGTPTE